MVHGLDDDGAFADSRRHALHRTAADVAHGKDACTTGCERIVGSLARAHKSLGVERDRPLQPSRAGIGADHDEQATGGDVFRRACCMVRYGDALKTLVSVKLSCLGERARLGDDTGDERALTSKNTKLPVELAGTCSDHPIVVGAVHNPGLSFEHDEQSGDVITNLDQNFVYVGLFRVVPNGRNLAICETSSTGKDCSSEGAEGLVMTSF